MGRPKAAGRPGPHPDPPSDLPCRNLPVTDHTTDLYRVHALARDPQFFGCSGANRWDAPEGQFCVMYTSTDPAGAFAETLLKEPGQGQAVSATMVAARGLARITMTSSLRCVDLRGPGLVQVGADARLTSGPHSISQRWSLSFWSHRSQPDGILYQSRRDPSCAAVAIFDRARGKLHATALGGLKQQHHALILALILARIYERYKVAELPP